MLKIVPSFKMPDSGFYWIRQLLLPFLLLMLDNTSLVTTHLESLCGKKLNFKKCIVLKETISMDTLM